MIQQIFFATLIFISPLIGLSNQIKSSVQCTDISPLHYWVESAWNQIGSESVPTPLNLDVWITHSKSQAVSMTTFEKLSGFVTKCEVQFSNLDEWHNYRDFHLKSLEGE
ncbi:MAG: hypothetical protein ACK5V3_17770 [Bdellovibrionales bacterium]